MEPKLDSASFTQYNGSFGSTNPGQGADALKDLHYLYFLAAEAFSHFTFCESDGKMLIVNLQGVRGLYTNPQIHTTSDSNIIGVRNEGSQGIQQWIQSHKCNDICKAKGLAELNKSGPLVTPGTAAAATAEPSALKPYAKAIEIIRAPLGPRSFASRKHPSQMTFEEQLALATQESLVQQPPGGPRVFNGSRQPTAAAGVASPGPGVTSSPKQISEMTEEEQMELAIMRSLQSR
jgi:hypothetical protein